MRDLIRTRWAAVGAAVAITLGAGGVSLTQAALTTGEKPVYVSLDAPCRVVDTRSGSPIGAGDAASLAVQITGENGACTGPLAIPADAVGVSTNVTVIQPNGAASGRSYFTVYPTGATRPVTSNLNFVNGQAPTPNKVDVGIGAGGQITIYNNEGTAHAAVDIFGYYIDHNHDDRYYQKSEVDGALTGKANSADVYTKTEVDTAVAAVPRPVAYGYVNANGSLAGGVGVNASSWDAGLNRYVIDLDVSYFFSSYATVVTTICNANVARTGSIGGDLLVYVTDGGNAQSQCGFGFVVYDVP